MQVTRLIVWGERWSKKKIREQGMLNVFAVEMWDTKLTNTNAQLEGNSALNVMGQDILRLYVKQRESKLMAEAKELEECIRKAIEELLFGRRIRTKLTQLQEFTVEDEIRDGDSERKEKGKVYADCKRNAHVSKIQRGDKVLLRQEKENKLSMTYKQSPFTVVQKNGNSVLVEANGIQYCENQTTTI